jgi:spore maturation protein CgeB
MKVLIIGSDYNWSIENIYKRELIKLGHEVIHIPAQNWFYDYYYKNAINKVLTRLGLSSIQRKIQKRTLTYLGENQFDLIWVFKGMELTPKTILQLKKRTKRIINFNPDNPFIFSGRGSGNKNVTNSICLFDEHFTYDLDVKHRIEKEFGIKCTLTSFGFDQEAISDEELHTVQEIKAVCFVGNPDEYRTQILKEILLKGLPLHVYGHDWDKFLNHPNLRIHGAVYEKEYYQTLRKYRVQLNIMRVHNLNSHNMRSIEIPGCGGIMLAPRTRDHAAFFKEGKDAFFYEDINELIMKVNEILAFEDSQMQQIKTQVREKTMGTFNYSILTCNFISI